MKDLAEISFNRFNSMYDQQSLLEMPNYENNLIFYKVMNYPIPKNSEYFLFEKKLPDLKSAT